MTTESRSTPTSVASTPSPKRPSRQRGPKSLAGLKISSKNAIKTGCTSEQLLTPEEVNQHHHLLKQLNKAYPSANPLIQIQIDRIAYQTILVQRIQQQLQIQMHQAKNNPQIRRDLEQAFQITPEEQLEFMLQEYLGDSLGESFILPPDVLHRELQRYELFRFEERISAESLLAKDPAMACYLYEVSQGQSINTYLLNQTPHERGNSLKIRKRFAKIQAALEPYKEHTITDAISAHFEHLSGAILKRFYSYYFEGFAYVLTLNQRLHDFKQRLAIEEGKAGFLHPDYQKLSRYYTAANNQLSKWIGELVVLVKSS